MGSRARNLLMGIATLLIIVIVYPYAEPVIEDIVAIVVAETGIASGLDFVIFDTMAYWLLAIAIVGTVYGIFRAVRGRR